MMKIAYIAHPIGGAVITNVLAILSIVKNINLTEPDVVPFAPYVPDCLSLDDDKPDHRSRGIKNGLELLNRGFIDEVRLYGPRISPGMWGEIKIAREYGIPVVAMTPETKVELDGMFTA